jgi:hypothetical protein
LSCRVFREGGLGGEGPHELQLVHLPGRKLRPCWPETLAWSFPLACHRVGRLRCPPGIGLETFVTGRSLRVDMLKPETPVLRGRRLWSVFARVWYATWVGRLSNQSGVGPETLVSGRRLRRWSHLGRRLRPSWPETPALVSQQRLYFMEDYIKPSSTSRRGCGFHSLSSIVAELQSPRSLSLATRTQSPFGI